MVAKNSVGSAVLRIYPSMKDFVRDLNKEIKAGQKSWPKAPIRVELDRDSVAKVKAEIDRAFKTPRKAKVRVEGTNIAATKRQIDAAAKDRNAKIRVTTDRKGLAQEFREINKRQKVEPVRVPVAFDVDRASLDDMLKSMRKVGQIQDDIARSQARLNGGMLDDEGAASEKQVLKNLRAELALRNQLATAAKAQGRDGSEGDVVSASSLRRALADIGEINDLKRKALQEELDGNEERAAHWRGQIQRHRDIGDLLQSQADRERTSELNSESSLRKRRKMMLSNREIELRSIRARQDGDREAMGRLAAERRMRAAMSTGSGDKSSGVMMNYRGLTALNLPAVAGAAAGLWSMVAALGGIVAGAAAAAGSLGVMAGVVTVGMSGVFKAFSELRSANQTASGQDVASASAASMDRIRSAQESVANSTQDLAKAQKDLGRSYMDATREIRDQNMELQDAVLSQEEAAIGVARARQNLAKVKADYRAGNASRLDVQEAVVGVKRSQASLRSAQNRVSDSKVDTAAANAKGVSGSDTVSSAKDRVSQAQQSQAQALRELAAAQRDAANGVGGANAAMNRFDETMKKLAPNARNFVNVVRGLGGEWKSLRGIVEQRLFEGLGSTFDRVARNQLPELKRGMDELAGTANGVLRDSLERVDGLFTKFSQDGTFDKWIESTNASWAGAPKFVEGFTQAITDLMIRIGPSLGRFFGELGTFLADGGKMWGDFGAKTVDGLTRFMPMLNRMFEVLLPVAERVLPVLERVIGVITEGLASNSDGTDKALRSLGEALVTIADAVVILLPVFTGIVDILSSIVSALGPGVVAGILLFGFAFKSILSPIIGAANQTVRAIRSFGELRQRAGQLSDVLGRLRQWLAGVGRGMTNTGSGSRTASTGLDSVGRSARTSAESLRLMNGQLARTAALAGKPIRVTTVAAGAGVVNATSTGAAGADIRAAQAKNKSAAASDRKAAAEQREAVASRQAAAGSDAAAAAATREAAADSQSATSGTSKRQRKANERRAAAGFTPGTPVLSPAAEAAQRSAAAEDRRAQATRNAAAADAQATGAANNKANAEGRAAASTNHHVIASNQATGAMGRLTAAENGNSIAADRNAAANQRAAASTGVFRRGVGRLAGGLGMAAGVLGMMSMMSGSASASTGEAGESAGMSGGMWAFMGLTIASMVLPALGSLGPVLGVVGKALVAVGNAAKGLMLTLMANPIFLVIGAVVALGVALWAFFTKTETGRKLWDKLWNGIKSIVSGFIGWLKRNWPLILAILTGPIGLAVLAIVKNWDKIKSAFGKVVDWIKEKWNWLVGLFSPSRLGRNLGNLWQGLKDGFKKALNWVIQLWNKAADKLSFNKPSWLGGGKVKLIPHISELRATGGPILSEGGADAIRNAPKANVAPGGFVVNARSTRRNRGLLEALGGSMLRGPGNGTSDSIVGVHNGRATARVSNGEMYFSPDQAAPIMGMLHGINDGDSPRSVSGLPAFQRGGELDGKEGPGSAKDALGSDAWHNQWDHYWYNYSGDDDGPGWKDWQPYPGELSSDATPAEQAEFDRKRDEARQRNKDFSDWLAETGQREKFLAGGLPGDVTLASIQGVEDSKKRNQAQIDREKADAADIERKKGDMHRRQMDAWRAFFAGDKNGGWENRHKYFERNKDMAELYNSNAFPPPNESVRWDDPSTWEMADGSLDISSGDDGSNTGSDNIGADGSINDDGSYTPSTGDYPTSPESDNPLVQAANKAVDRGKEKGIDVSIAVTDPNTGESITAGGTDAMPSASLIKLGVAAAAAKAIGEGKLSLGQVKPNLDPMISRSSNEDTNALIDMLGGFAAVNSSVSAMGVTSGDYSLGRRLGVSFDGDDPNKMTASGANKLLTLIHDGAKGKSGAKLPKDASNAIVDAMRAQQVDTKFGAVLPNGGIAHKTGELGGASHDSGYIFDGERWLEVTVMTNNGGSTSQEANNAIIQDFAKEVYGSKDAPVRGEASNMGTSSSNPGNGKGEALSRADSFIQAQVGKPYLSPPNPPANWDCSMLQSGIYASLTDQDPMKRYFTTEGGSKGDFESYGFVKGLIPGAYQIGVMRGGGGPNSHMAGTMPNGDHVESGGSTSGVTRGPGAAGADDPQFKLHWSLPQSEWKPVPTNSSTDSADDAGLYDDTPWDIPEDGPAGANGDPGIKASTAIDDAMVNGTFSPRRFAENYGAAAAGETYDAALRFFGLESSVLSSNNELTSAIDKAYTDWGKAKEKREKGNAPSAGDGDVGDDKTKQLQQGDVDPNAPGNKYGQTQGDKTIEGVGKLTMNSTKEEIASAIIGESQKHGFKPDESVAEISTGLQESGLDPKAQGGGGAWHGIYQQDASYADRDDPNKNIAGFMQRLAEKTSIDPTADIWKRIFWLQQAPSAASAESAYQGGRQAYLTEIQSQKAVAQSMYDKIMGHADGGWVTGRGGPREDNLIRRLSNGEHVTSADSASEAGPILEWINSSPRAARQAMEMFGGVLGGAANAVAPGSGSAIASALGIAGGAAEAGLTPFAAAAASVSSAERDRLADVQTYPMAFTRPGNGPAGRMGSTPTVDRSVNYNGDIHLTDLGAFQRRQADDQNKQFIGALGNRGY